MRLYRFINELLSQYGKGISFIDVDDCLFYTFAKIDVIDDITGKVVRSLTNQEFNTYELEKNTSFDFHEFRSAEMFRKTSIPISKTVNRIKRMFKNIDKRGSKIILLTARSDFDDKEEFLQAFRDHGIPIDKMYVERAGNIKTGTTAQKKEVIVMKYLKTGLYRRVRLVDDDITNVKQFLSIEKKIPQSIIDKVKSRYKIPDDEDFPVISFFGLLVREDGSLQRITI